jgi:hypothetical protein
MTFLELFRKLEAQLGYHQLPLNPAPTTLKTLFESSPLHHETMMQLAQAIYAANGCRTLGDPVARDVTQEAVAPIRLQVLQNKRTDVDLYRYIEEFCIVLDRAFGPRPVRATAREATPKGQVIPIAPFRRRIKTLV